ncbi:MAG: DUF3987 domain-containing protein [Clostridia bacterium]|nr:DUF3987 domain-containing protein [Clostridia bacterium]
MNDIESLSRLTENVEAARVDIAPTYNEYVQLAFAIANDCGEAGRELFHRLCRLSTKYDFKHAERIYSNALTTGKGDAHLGTVFYLAEKMGIELKKELEISEYKENEERKKALEAEKTPPLHFSHVHVPYNADVENELIDEKEEAEKEKPKEGSEPLCPLPTFPTYAWPPLLSTIIGYGTSPAQQDIMLLGALTALGASLGHHVQCFYGGKKQHPCLQTFIVAQPASGKGVLTHIRLLVEPIHDEIRQKVNEEMRTYQKEKAVYDTLGKERQNKECPKPPINRMFLITGNNTGTGITQNLIDSGGTGLIFETEADTLSGAIASDHGHFSDTLRKAFDHDRISYNRRMNEEYKETPKCYLSVLLSGTPAQVKPLIPSVENGLFSREIFYYMPAIRRWENQFNKNGRDLEEIFRKLGEAWKEQVKIIKEHGIHTLELTAQQQEELNNHFEQLFDRSYLANDNEMASSVARLAVNTCRILSEVALLRLLENPNPYAFKESTEGNTFMPGPDVAPDNIKDGIISRWSFTISDSDFKAVLALTTPLYRHATHILSFLPENEVGHRSNADRDAFFNTLGEHFTRKEVIAKADELNINQGTATSWVTRLLGKGILVKPDNKPGVYERAHKKNTKK